ncbi:MAG: NAD(P)-binding protein, partial [Anaerolineaceae bacterium]|nr:NAD(P)-binding protein [Anaerolineaceae bacterium]
MINTSVIIVGGGPAGAACAWRLKQANVDTILLDQQKFPRVKPCAGWISPKILSDLGFRPGDYPYGLTTFSQFRVSIRGFQFTLPARQYAIRRLEFDDWLLQRAGVAVEQHTVTNIYPSEGGYDVDGKYFGKYLVGAGGTYCPVYRAIFHALSPRSRESLIVAQEEEFAFDYTDTQCRLWFLEHGLPGYAWYVPKTNGYLNVGVGGNAQALKKGDHLMRHWQMLVDLLERMGLVKGH